MNNYKKDEMEREIADINRMISRLSSKIRNCCGLNKSLCIRCNTNHWEVIDLKDKRLKIKEELSK